jgi:hypothetical protein
VLSGDLGGDLAHLAGLTDDMRGVFLADIDLRLDGPELVGDVAQAAAGTTLTGPDGTTPIEIAGVHPRRRPRPRGTSTRSTSTSEG